MPQLYGIKFGPTVHPLRREFICIEKGGRWKLKSGNYAGKGLFYHYKEAIRLIWPEFAQHRWFDLILKEWLDNKYIGIMGPKSSGKTSCCAIIHLVDYYAFPTSTTTILCTTEQARLEDRVWGEVKKWHKVAKDRIPWLPGNMIESKYRIVSDKYAKGEARDFRNGIVGVACKKGVRVDTLSSFIGIKNKRVRLYGDELSLLPKSFIDSIANLSGNAGLKVCGSGNPSQTTDPLGFLCEPSADLGGWDGGIDQRPGTKSWKTRLPSGVAIQLPGSDSPNNDTPPGKPLLYPYLICERNMQEDAAFWGSDDWHFTMFNEGRMPRGQGSRRVITRRICEKNGSMLEPLWKNTQRTKIAFLDAAYRAVGGDRCVFGILEYGPEAGSSDMGSEIATGFINQRVADPNDKIIMALTDLKTVPLTDASVGSATAEPEEEIVQFVRTECELQGIPPSRFFFDSGMRTSLVTAFARLWSPDVNGIDCGGKPSNRNVSAQIPVKCSDYYSKYITELWYSVRLIIEAGQFRGMTQDLMTEGCMREWMTVSGNKIEIEPKREMKRKTGRSPDLFDALAIGCEGARRSGFVIGKLGPVEETATDSRWKTDLRKKATKLAHSGALTYS